MPNTSDQINAIPNFTAVLSIIITLYISLKTLFTPLKLDVAKQQLYKVYLPLFTAIEPHLYELPSRLVLDEFIQIFSKIKSEHYELIPSDLFLLFDDLSTIKCKNKFAEDTYDSFCHHIEKNFDKLRKRLSLPTRGFSYKLKYSQFHAQLRSFMDSVVEILTKLILMILLFLVVSLLIKFALYLVDLFPIFSLPFS